MHDKDLTQIATSSTDDSSTVRWQCLVMVKKLGKPNDTVWQRSARVVSIRSVVGHTVMPVIQDDRLRIVIVGMVEIIAHALRITLSSSIRNLSC